MTEPIPEQPARVRFPREGEILGVVTGLMGGSRMTVLCNDGKERMCRIPGKMKKKIWVKEGDAVAVMPWAVEGEKKADIVWRYGPLETSILRKKGLLKV
ncbi:MAG: translation initiation factor eIF-1A [Candidatus Micrarchaeota archaeon]